MNASVRDLLDLPGLLDVWSEREHAVPTAGELSGAKSRATAYRWAAEGWPTVRVGGRLRVQTTPFLRDLFGIELMPPTHQPETDVTEPPVP